MTRTDADPERQRDSGQGQAIKNLIYFLPYFYFMKKHRRSKRWDTKQQAEKKWTSSKIWISLFFVAILVISTIGYFSSNVDSVYSIKYNGTVIFQDPETFEWYIEQDGKTV